MISDLDRDLWRVRALGLRLGVARTAQEQLLGLRDPRFSAMLFVWPYPGLRSMTMKDMDRDLAMNFYNNSGMAVARWRRVPAGYPVISAWAQYVLEMPAE